MLKQKLTNYSIILASGSPRRQQFFKDLDLDFEIRLKDVEEIYPPELKAEEITNYLAELKANAFEGELNDNEILITSDTIVWHNNTALGKPKDEQDAFAILKSLSNTTHEVITSVCFKTNEKIDTFFEVTKVSKGILVITSFFSITGVTIVDFLSIVGFLVEHPKKQTIHPKRKLFLIIIIKIFESFLEVVAHPLMPKL